jgi:hypothetical protein
VTDRTKRATAHAPRAPATLAYPRDAASLEARSGEAAELLRGLVREVHMLRERVDALETGKRALDAGRAKANEAAKRRGAASTAVVLDLALIDLRAGKPARGRAGRIRRTLGGLLSERQVRRILAALFSVSDSVVSNADGDTELRGRSP